MEKVSPIVPSEKPTDNRHNLGGSSWTSGITLLYCVWLNTRTVYPESCQSHLPWRYSKSVWMWFCAVNSRSSCLVGGMDKKMSNVLFQPQTQRQLGERNQCTMSEICKWSLYLFIFFFSVCVITFSPTQAPRV